MFVICDGSFGGLLSAVAWCLRRRVIPDGLLTDLDPLPLLESVNLQAEPGIRALFQRHYTSLMGADDAGTVLDTVFRAWLSEMPGIGTAIYGYLSAALLRHHDPAGKLTDPDIAAVVGAAKKVSGQAHQYLGLLRFRKAGPLLYLAEFEPDYHVLPLVLPHFADRLADQEFVICDRRRGIAAWHHASRRRCSLHWLAECELADGSSETGLSLAAGPAGQASQVSLPFSSYEDPRFAASGQGDDFELMWREYLHRLTIPERCNLFLQRGNLPLKYRRFMTEFNRDGLTHF